MSFLRPHMGPAPWKNNMSPSGEILAHNDFLGNKEDALCCEPQTRPTHMNHFAFCYQEGQTAAFHLNEKLIKLDLNEKLLHSSSTLRVHELTTQHNTIQQVLLATFTRSPVPFLKVTKTQHNKFCEPLSGIFVLKKRTQN